MGVIDRPTPHPVKAVLASQRRSNTWLAEQTGFNAAYLGRVINGLQAPGARCRRKVTMAVGLPEPALWDLARLGLGPVGGRCASGPGLETPAIVALVTDIALPTGPARLTELSRIRSLCTSGRARQIRAEADIELAELGEAVDVHPHNIYRWEQGVRTPTGDAALRYLHALDLLERSLEADVGGVA